MSQPATKRTPDRIAVDAVILAMGPVLESLCEANTWLVLRLQAQDAVATISSKELECIVLNLVSNALESISLGGFVCVSTSVVVVARKRHVRLECTNDGEGLSPDSHTRLVRNGLSSKRRGVGLALRLVRELARYAGGRVEAIRQPSGSAKFAVILPVLEADEQKLGA